MAFAQELNPLKHPIYRSLYTAQIIALVGTGLLTVGLGLFAYDIAGNNASAVMGIAMTVKILAYVFVAPVMAAVTSRWGVKQVLVSCDILRAGVACLLPFVQTPLQIYVLIFVLQAASATFTPTFQALIPQILTDEAQYTRALSFSRVAYNVEAIGSPVLAAALLLVIHYNTLFVGTALGFMASAALIGPLTLPPRTARESEGFWAQTLGGIRIFVARAELRALFGMYFVTACATAMIIVNTTVVVRSTLHEPASYVPLLLGAAGCGEVIAALLLPRYLDRHSDRGLMQVNSTIVPVLLLGVGATLAWTHGVFAWVACVLCWMAMGAATSAVLTPAGRVIRRNVESYDLSSVFAADFSLSHSCYLVTYLGAGLVGAQWGMGVAALFLGLLALPALVYALRGSNAAAA